ncbi:hypothetical protein [Cellulomonas hominis]
MSELAYMNRWQWAEGFEMEAHSRTARDWLGDRAHWVAVRDRASQHNPRDADFEVVDLISPPGERRGILEFRELVRVANGGAAITDPVLFVHPSDDEEAETVRRLVAGGLDSAFVMTWSELDLVRLWLEARSAVNLLASEQIFLPDPLVMKAAEAMVIEEYNGLSGGRGKDTVIQSLRALHAEGYPLSSSFWGRSVLGAGGSFESARTVMRFTKEMAEGRRHRTKPRFRPEIVSIWQEMLAQDERDVDLEDPSVADPVPE